MLEYAELLLLVSNILGEDDDNDLAPLILEEEQELYGDDDVSDLLELEDLLWLETASLLTGDGSRGPYNQFPKTQEFFSTSLQSPDHQFRHIFWCVYCPSTLHNNLTSMNFINRLGRDTFDQLVAILGRNPIFTSTGWKPQRHVKF